MKVIGDKKKIKNKKKIIRKKYLKVFCEPSKIVLYVCIRQFHSKDDLSNLYICYHKDKCL